MRPRRLFALLNRWRTGASPLRKATVADAAGGAVAIKLDRLMEIGRIVEIASEAGARQERARMAAIAMLPNAERFPRLALSLALTGVVTPDQAAEAFAAAESDALARSQPTEPAPAAIDGKAAPTLH